MKRYARSLAASALLAGALWAASSCKSPLVDLIREEVVAAVTLPELSAVFPLSTASEVAPNSSISMTFTKTVDASTVGASTIVVTDGSGVAVTGRFTVDGATVTFTPSGGFGFGRRYTVTITTGLKDSDGRSLAADYSWYFTTSLTPDVTPPSISLLAFGSSFYASADERRWTSSRTVTLDVQALDDRGVAQVQLASEPSMAAAPWVTYDPDAEGYGITLPAKEGAARVYARVKDGAGNLSAVVASGELWLDTTPPEVLNAALGGGTGSTNAATVGLEVTAEDDTAASGVADFRYRARGSVWSEWQALALEGAVGRGAAAGLAISTTPDTTTIVEVEARDNAGNVSALASGSIHYELTPPTVLSVSWPSDSPFPYNGSVIRVTFDERMKPGSFGSGSLVIAVVGGGAVQGTVSLAAANGVTDSACELWGLSLSPNTQYRVTLSSTVADAAGNELGGSDKVWYLATGDAVDSSPPTGPVSLSDQGGTVAVAVLPSGAKATDDAVVVLDFSAVTDDYNMPYGIKVWGDNDGSVPAEKSFEQDASWIPWTATVTWHLSTSLGPKYLLYKLMDSAGNESPSPIQLKVVLDNAAPTIAAVALAGGITHTNDADRRVGLELSASDAHSGLKEMMISNSNTFAGASWVPWAPTLEEWILPDGDGSRTFYVKVRDYLDQESTVNSGASVTLDRQAPSVAFTRAEIIESAELRLLEGGLGTDYYAASDAYGLGSTSWAVLSGPGALFLNVTAGGGQANDGKGHAEPYAWATAEGLYFVKVTVTDKAGNSSSASSALTWDTTPPGAVASVSADSYSMSGQPTWTWAAVADADYYRVSLSSDFSSYADVMGTSYTPNAPLTPDGSKTLYVRAQDRAGNYSAPASRNVFVDTAPPAIGVTTQAFVANIAAPTVSLDFSGGGGSHGSISDPGAAPSGVKTIAWSKASGPGALAFGSPSASATSASADADGQYQVRLTVTDNAGHASSAYLSLTRDTGPPSAPTVDGPALTPSLRPTWYWSGGGGGSGSFRYRLFNATDSIAVVDWTLTSATSFTPAGNLTDKRNYTLSVRELDSAGNESAIGSKATEVDSSQTTPPQITLGDGSPLLRTISSVTWNVLSGSGGIASSYRYAYDGGATWTTVGTGLNAVTPTAFTRTGLSDGQHSIRIQEFFNGAWQEAKEATHVIVVDTTAPTKPSLSGAGLATATPNRSATADTTPTWTWSPGGGGNGLYRYRVTRPYAANGAADGATIVALTGETGATSYTPGSAFTDGTYRLEVEERDAAGNWSGYSYWLVTVDTVLPTLSSVTLRGPSHPSDSDYTYTRSATVSVDIVGSIGSEANSAFSRPVAINMYDYNPSAWEDHPTPYPAAASTTIETTLPSGDGSKTVYVRLRDEAGNVTAYRNDTIILDATAPSGTFQINAGAATTPSLSFYLTLSASDAISPSSEIEVSLRSPITLAYGTYRTYATSMLSDSQFSPSAGSKAAYIKFRDGAGNESTYSDSITLEAPVPTYAAKGLYAGGYTYVYYNPVTDPAGGTYTTRYYVYSTTVAGANPNNGDPVTYRYNTTSTSSCYAPIEAGTLHYFFVRAYDADTGGYGPYSATSVLGFSSNVTVVYDDDEPADVNRAGQIRTILTDTASIAGNGSIVGTMPTWTVTLLPEDLISTSYDAANLVYGDPVMITHGASFSTSTSLDGMVRNLAATNKGIIAMGQGGANFLSRVDANWTAWALSGTRPADIHGGKQMILTAAKSMKTRPASTSESIWFSPLYYVNLYINYLETSVAANGFTTDVDRRGVYISSGANPTGGYIYAGDTYSTAYFPVVRQGSYCFFGYYEIPNVQATGQVFLIDLVARMDNF